MRATSWRPGHCSICTYDSYACTHGPSCPPLPHGGLVTVQFNPYLVIQYPIVCCVLRVNALWVGLWKYVPPLTLTLTLTFVIPILTSPCPCLITMCLYDGSYCGVVPMEVGYRLCNVYDGSYCGVLPHNGCWTVYIHARSTVLSIPPTAYPLAIPPSPTP